MLVTLDRTGCSAAHFGHSQKYSTREYGVVLTKSAMPPILPARHESTKPFHRHPHRPGRQSGPFFIRLALSAAAVHTGGGGDMVPWLVCRLSVIGGAWCLVLAYIAGRAPADEFNQADQFTHCLLWANLAAMLFLTATVAGYWSSTSRASAGQPRKSEPECFKVETVSR